MLKVDLNLGTYQGPGIRRDVSSALNKVSEIVSAASALTLDIVLFPELFLCGYDISVSDVQECAIRIDSEPLQNVASIAKSCNVAIGVGFAERASDGKVYNSCCVFDATGSLLVNYRKTHLWDPTKTYEKVAFAPGSDLPVADIYIPRTGQTITFGVMICFDSEFPEPARTLALKGASFILSPTALAAGLVDDITPRITVPCRAMENHVFVVYSNYSGPCLAEAAEVGFKECFFCGQSGIVGPNGRDLVRATKSDAGLFHCSVKGDQYAEDVRRNDFLAERQPSLYTAMRPASEPLICTLPQIKAALPSCRALMAAMEVGFKSLSGGTAFIAPVQHMAFPHGDACVKSGFKMGSEASTEEAFFVTKVASGHPNNPSLGLGASSGVMLLFSQLTGKLKSILLDDGYLTDVRTAIGSCLAIQKFGPREVACIGVMGTGVQARFHLEMLRDVTSCRRIVLCGRSEGKLQSLQEDAVALGYTDVCITTDPSVMCRECNVVITVTSSRAPLISAEHVRPGTMLVAVGADGMGKQEIDPLVFANDRVDLVLVDSTSQSCVFGETSHAIQHGLLSSGDCIEIGSALSALEHGVVTCGGVKLVRAGDKDANCAKKLTVVYDSTGVAVQDVQIAEAVYKSMVSLQKTHA